jgi:hypothetical protein
MLERERDGHRTPIHSVDAFKTFSLLQGVIYSTPKQLEEVFTQQPLDESGRSFERVFSKVKIFFCTNPSIL